MSRNDDDSKARFGSFLFGEDGMFAEFSDNQRLERLKQCSSIEKSLRECQEIHRKVKTVGSENISESQKSHWWWPMREKRRQTKKTNEGTIKSNDITVEEMNGRKELRNDFSTTKTEIKIARFFNWQDENNDHPKSNEGNSKSPVSNDHCVKETHAVWACRALALGCASDLVSLKECFQKKNQNSNTGVSNDVGKKNDDACRKAQIKLSKCVDFQASALNERIRERRGNKNTKK